MKRLSFFAFLMALCLPLSARAEDPPAALKSVHRIVCLGDSITQGGEGPGGYVWLLRHYLTALYPQQNFEVLNSGISGHKSTDMLARFQRDVLDKKPDMVTISVGVNDVWHGFYDNHPYGDGPRGVPIEAYRKNVEDMITQAEKAGIHVVVMSTTVIQEDLTNRENGKLASYNAELRDLARSHKAIFVDEVKAFRTILDAYHGIGGSDNILTVDGVHMRRLGDRIMAHAILDALGVPMQARIEGQHLVDDELRKGGKEPRD